MERKDMKLGFIGFGNMAQAIAEGLLTVVVFNVLEKYSAVELQELSVL